MARPTEIHNEIAKAWNARDFNQLRNLYHPEYTYTGGDGKEMTGGPEAGLNVMKMYASAFPDGVLEVKRVFTQGDTAIAELTGRGTQTGEFMGVPPTHRRVEVRICNVIELRDGKAYREREYMDMLSIMTQLGITVSAGKVKMA
ncbi:MAG: ester cyclase [Acidobacteria bacterium]|nr:ester cyclase [Acidobacteriota bacterium]